MSSFPPRKWEVRFLRDMNSMACSDPEGEDEIKMEALMAIKPSGSQEGSFRFVLSGNKPVKLKFNVESVIPSKLFGGMVAEGELKIGDQIEMDKNSACPKWMDNGHPRFGPVPGHFHLQWARRGCRGCLPS